MKIVVVQTPMGLLKVALPALPSVNGEDPLAVAMEMFQGNVDKGVADPLTETLLGLKEMADAGAVHPLTVGLALLKQMSENGMLPPMGVLIEGTGITEAYVNQALTDAAGEVRPTKPGILERMQTIHLN